MLQGKSKHTKVESKTKQQHKPQETIKVLALKEKKDIYSIHYLIILIVLKETLCRNITWILDGKKGK